MDGYDVYNLENFDEVIRQKKRKRIALVLIAILLAVVVIGFIRYALPVVKHCGGSMEPTYHDGDELLVWRPFYHPQNGDVVVLNAHGGHILSNGNVISSGYSLNEYIVKRIVATEGETIEIDAQNGKVYLNGVLLGEEYIKEPTYTNDHAFEYPITIPKGYVFVMGDNRNHSTDSRSAAVGLVDVKDIYGVVIN